MADPKGHHLYVNLSEPIENLRNLGPTSAAWLRDVGISTLRDLEDGGPVFAYLQVKRRNPKVSLNLLWALAAGLQNRDWRELTEAERQRLRSEIE